MSHERKGANKLWRMISFSWDLTHLCLKFSERLPFSAAEAFQTVPGFPSQTATIQKWPRGPIY